MDAARDAVVDVVVIGGGLAGLTAGATAARAGASVVVLDTRGIGGRARTSERDGYLLNAGPHALYGGGAGYEVLARLGLPLEGSSPPIAAMGYERATDRMRRLPTSAGSLLRTDLVGVGDKVRLARLLTSIGRIDLEPLVACSATEWIASLGLAPNGAAALATLVRLTTYAEDFDSLSADAVVSQLAMSADQGVRYLDGGWSSIVDGLAAVVRASGARIDESAAVTAVDRTPDGDVVVRVGERSILARSVVIAAGSPAAARGLVPDAPSWHLGAPATAACLDLGLSEPPAVRAAYGLDEPLYLSTHTPSARLAPEGGSVVHVMRYGSRGVDVDRAELRAFAARCGVREDGVVVDRFLASMVVCPALPAVGHGLAGRPGITETGIDGVLLAGDWVGPTGMLADASIASGDRAGLAAATRAVAVPR